MRHVETHQDERGQPPGAERQAPLAVAFPGHRDETVGARDQAVVDDEQQHAEHDEGQRERRSSAVIGQARQRVELEIDAVAEHVDFCRQTDDQRQLELLGGDQRDQDQRRKQSRQQHRQRDPAEGGHRRGTGRAARLFQRRVHGAQRGGEQQEHERRRGQRLAQDQAAHAENIDRPGAVHAERRPDREIEPARVRSHQEDPGDGENRRRHQQWKQDERKPDFASWKIGALDQPCEAQSDCEHDERPCQRRRSKVSGRMRV